MEKLKLRLSKQRNKMLKIKSEMLKIRKNVEIIKLEKISRENFGKFPESRQSRRFREFPGIPKKLFENFPSTG